MTEKVLVTGAAGFIGREVVRILVDRGYEVSGLDNFSFSNRDQILHHPQVYWVSGDTRDERLVSELVRKCDHVMHLAAPSSFIMHEEDDISACSFTMMGFKTLMEAMRREGKKRIVWASTSAVYELWDTPARVPFFEDMPLDPPDSKAGCKHWCEMEALRYHHRYGFTSIAFRPFSVYGVGEHTKLGYANVTSLFTWAMMAGHRPIIWGDGEQTRDFIFVEDVARAFCDALEKTSLPTCALNLGFGVEHTFNEVVELIGERLDVTPDPIRVDVPIQIYAYRLWADMEKTKTLLGFEPRITLAEGVDRIIAATHALPERVLNELNLGMQQHYFEKLGKYSDTGA